MNEIIDYSQTCSTIGQQLDFQECHKLNLILLVKGNAALFMNRVPDPPDSIINGYG